MWLLCSETKITCHALIGQSVCVACITNFTNNTRFPLHVSTTSCQALYVNSKLLRVATSFPHTYLPSFVASFIITAPILSLLVTRRVLCTPMVGTLMCKSQSNSLRSASSSAIFEQGIKLLFKCSSLGFYHLLAVSKVFTHSTVSL